MKKSSNAVDLLILKAGDDDELRKRLLARPKETIEQEFGVTMAEDHEIHVHEETAAATHIVLPPRNRFTREEREEARTGASSFAFLRKTMHDPAPPLRPPGDEAGRVPGSDAGAEVLAEAARESIRRGLDFLESTIDEHGAWHCIRFNVADPKVPRHFERPPFISAFCVLALENCREAKARSICTATSTYLVDTIEYPGFWRYYRHLPQDLDSTSLCSLVIGTHPWILLGRNIPRILANRDGEGRFMTWMLEGDEPDVVSRFRIEADPVVNANVIAWLGDCPETRDAQRWLEALITEGDLKDASKWYPDEIAICYAVARAVRRVSPALDRLRPVLADRVLGLADEEGGYGNVLQTAQAVSTLCDAGCLERTDATRPLRRILTAQRGDGSWPELLAFGDQTLKFGAVGQIGHGSEAVTTAFCIEALERLAAFLRT
ncbi:MAG: hypothetical protein F4X08_06055 [Gemmatimonadetes bacterium]|nr:hypothetical protein [Gemmatimonadota bacterium]MYI98923.1 hypothetical protein [Gemmatimonadota bacterium]